MALGIVDSLERLYLRIPQHPNFRCTVQELYRAGHKLKIWSNEALLSLFGLEIAVALFH